MSTKYRLLHDIFDANAGTIFNEGHSNDYWYHPITGNTRTTPKEFVENNPTWFSPVIEDTEKIEVTDISFYQKHGSKTIMASLSSCILDDELPAIKSAIENILNPPSPAPSTIEGGVAKKDYESHIKFDEDKPVLDISQKYRKALKDLAKTYPDILEELKLQVFGEKKANQ